MNSLKLKIWGDSKHTRENALAIPIFGLMRNGITSWTGLQEKVFDTFENEDHVRQYLEACLTSLNNFPGVYTCTLEQLVPDYMRCFPGNTEQGIVCDMPIDDEIPYVLAGLRITRQDNAGSEDVKKLLYHELGIVIVPGRNAGATCTHRYFAGSLSACQRNKNCPGVEFEQP